VRLSIVSLVLLLLVYQLPAAVLVYWTSNNIISLLRAVIGGRAGNTQAE
jgi:membrane protein insertase Oxa1/YidC/SpoIIIJ